ncbi:HAD family phosphatase [uncultured Brachyspira sp.]|uniref:HAD family hydrolase n=1 Tax=uncultured Brachyspira sp. TaxID=221953 RepID=UPI0025D50F7B|nr:HAD family phosphatase [uncultured Brachyspira sp.]
MKIKAILFDMDGVLIDAKDWHYEALNKSLGLFGYDISRYEHLLSYDGLPTKVKLERLTLEKGLPKYLHSFINEMKQQYTMNIVQNYCRPKFNHEYALSKLKANNYKLGLCSNSIKKTVDIMMKMSFLYEYFDIKLNNEDVINPKPDPEIYNKAISMLKLYPEECLVLEDNENGINAAKASGAHILIVKSVNDVNYINIMNRINEIEG